MALDLSVLPVARLADLYTADDLPECGLRPVAESETHTLQKSAALAALRWHFQDEPQTCVTGNMFVYFWNEHGQLEKQAPDIFVARGVSKKRRRVYYVEEEGKPPNVIIEFASRRTRILDVSYKPPSYASLGVREYFVYTPESKSRKSRLLGFTLTRKKYAPMATQPRLHSNVLKLDLAAEEDGLNFYDSRTGKKLITPDEAHLKLRHETAARQAAEAEVIRLREELARLQKS